MTDPLTKQVSKSKVAAALGVSQSTSFALILSCSARASPAALALAADRRRIALRRRLDALLDHRAQHAAKGCRGVANDPGRRPRCALDLWFKSQEATAADAAAMPQIGDATRSLIDAYAANPAGSLADQFAGSGRRTSDDGPVIRQCGYIGCLIVARDGTVLASFREELIGKNVKQLYEQQGFIESALAGTPQVSRPFPSTVMLPDKHGRLSAGQPTMFAAAPVRLDEGKPSAALLLRIRPEDDFTRILNVARVGESGETYAIDSSGLMLSSSRFTEQIKQLGLIPNTEDSDSILTLQVRDPGVDLTQGEAPVPGPRPLTAMAQEATAGRNGINVDGYRGYRGVPKVSAWLAPKIRDGRRQRSRPRRGLRGPVHSAHRLRRPVRPARRGRRRSNHRHASPFRVRLAFAQGDHRIG